MSLGNLVTVAITGILLLALAGVIVVTGLGDADESEERIENAVEVEATVVETDVERERRNGETRYEPVVRFEYDFEGETYESDLLYPTSDGRLRDERGGAYAVVSDYDEGETTTAYVDPSHPDEAFLNDARSSPPFVVYIAGAATALFGLVLLGDAVRRFRKR